MLSATGNPRMVTHTSPIDLDSVSEVFFNPSIDLLIEHCTGRDNCRLTDTGAVVATTGKYTGRTPKDKVTVRDASTEDVVWWENNRDISPSDFALVRAKVVAYLQSKPLYVIDTFAGADPGHRLSVRFVVERPYHALFIKQLLIRPTEAELAEFAPDWTILDAGKLSMTPGQDPVAGDAMIGLSFADQQVIIAGTEYAGEMKKSVFTIMNALLPQAGILSMHCSANIGPNGHTALFFGLSGTGKTTLSADNGRQLIGDDEHGWTDRGVFNIEGGCYAKCIGLTAEGEPEIYHAIRRGAVLENVVLDAQDQPDYSSAALTENTRAAYPLENIETAIFPSLGSHPADIVFLTCDALGVLPPISRLTEDQAMAAFLNGYTAKVAGTEAGVTEPTLTFSTCFGAPFLPLPPKAYAELLREKIRKHGSRVWLVNTGWTGGPYGVGQRIKLRYTRAMIRAAFDGLLDNVRFEADPVFGYSVPTECPEVPTEVLRPRQTWADPEAYDNKAIELKAKFDENLNKFS